MKTILLAAVLLLGVGLFAGCNDGEDPAEMMLRQSGGSTASTTAPPAEPAADAAVPPAGDGAAVEGEVVEGEVVEGAAAEGEVPADEAGEAAAPAGEAEAADETVAADEATDEPVAEDAGMAAGEEAVEEEAGADAETGDEVAAEADGFIEEEEAPVSDDPIENFKNLDPRDIITKKYEDMEGRKTEPWNDENPETFIPRTGRVDPMTRVRDSVPDELKPPRAGETDQNDINSYLVASEATMIVDFVAQSLSCNNVIQVGLEKYATFSQGGQQFVLQEGQSTSYGMGSSTGITINISVTVTSITTDQVTVSVRATGQGTNVSIGKNLVFIPANQY